MPKIQHRTIRRDVAWLAPLVGAAAAVAAWSVMAGRGHSLTTTSPAVALVTYALVLGAAAAAYVLWRLAGVDEDSWNRRLSGWLSVGLTVGALPGFLLAFLQDTQEPGAPQVTGDWLLVNQVVVAAVLVMIVRVCERFDVAGDPALLGLVGGLVLTAATCVGVALAPGLRLGTGAAALVGTLLVLGPVLAWNLLTRSHVSPWVRQRLAFASVALVSAQAFGHQDGSAAAGAAIVANLLGGVVVCATALRLLRGATSDHHDQVARLRSALVTTEVAVHEQRDLLHELGSTLAGIASASEIIQQEPALPEPQRRRLVQMVEAEVGRLVRLMGDRPGPSRADAGIDVDEVLGTIVLSHQARGVDVRWLPSGGLIASGRADDLAEVVNILLDNAGRHAAGAPVTVSASASRGMVEIACADLGPGVPTELRTWIFESGSRAPHSPGQGLGLSIAKRLMAEQGGALVLRPSTAGATFLVLLPELALDRRTAREVAHAS